MGKWEVNLEAGKMNHRVEAVCGKERVRGGLVAHVNQVEIGQHGARGAENLFDALQRLGARVAQVIHHVDRVALGGEKFDECVGP